MINRKIVFDFLLFVIELVEWDDLSCRSTHGNGKSLRVPEMYGLEAEIQWW